MATYMRVGEALELTGLWVQDLPRLTTLVKPWDSQSQQDQTPDPCSGESYYNSGWDKGLGY